MPIQKTTIILLSALSSSAMAAIVLIRPGKKFLNLLEN
jgi:hypothetical protein